MLFQLDYHSKFRSNQVAGKINRLVLVNFANFSMSGSRSESETPELAVAVLIKSQRVECKQRNKQMPFSFWFERAGRNMMEQKFITRSIE